MKSILLGVALIAGSLSLSGCLGPNVIKTTPDHVMIGCSGIFYFGRMDAGDALANKECVKANPGITGVQALYVSGTSHVIFDRCYYDCISTTKQGH